MSKRKENSENNEPSTKKLSYGIWVNGLVKSMTDPELVIKKDDLVTVIKDMYPKAEFHYLILPQEHILSLKEITKEHLYLLKHMDAVAKELISEERHTSRSFNIGYHAEPSMFRLHLHVISTDMNSPCVKTKRHWNSFTTNFFLKSDEVIESLEKNGKVTLPSKEICKKLVDSPLRCHKCEYSPKNLPDLKKHIFVHL